MSLSIVQQPDAISFSSALKDVILSTAASVNISLSDKSTSAIIIAETYMPDMDNLVYIRNLGKVLEAIIDKVTLVGAYTMTITETDNTVTTFDFDVQYGTTEIADYSTFIEVSYLTLLQGAKKTSIDRNEYISLKVSSDTPVQIALRYSSLTDGSLSNNLINLITVHESDGIVTLDVSPAQWAVDGKQIEQYAVISGSRVQSFIVDNISLPGAVSFVFINSFGVKEIFTCMGLSERENKYDGSLYGSNDGTYRKFYTKLVKQFTGNSGIMSQDEAEWIEDMFMSDSIYLYDSTGVGKEIAVIDPSVKRTSDPTELVSVSFTYRYVQENHNIYVAKPSNRLFDSTYDYTYD
jgi:hypothetical protein